MKTRANVKLIHSAADHTESIMEFNITPGEKTPWHYHTLFSESFEVMSGALEVGLNGRVNQLKKGDKVTIMPHEKHYFHNVSDEDCLIIVTISPGNRNFEYALQILKGLAKDGSASASGVPKKIADLALFVYLNNSKMVGFQKIAAPIFDLLAKKMIKKGRLDELIKRYCV